MTITDAQGQLLELLIREAMDARKNGRQRWENPTSAQRHAARGHLLLVQDWTQDTVLTKDGTAVVVDTEDGDPPRTATEHEARIGLFRAIARYPELLSFLPSRPAEAVDCSSCGGTGVWPGVFQRPGLRDVVCQCGGAGWRLPSDEVVTREA